VKRYKSEVKEATMVTINNKDTSVRAVEEGIKFLYDKFGEDIRFEKLVAYAIFRGLVGVEDIKSSMLLINKYVRELANKR
jgi:hypothetical protein